MKQAPNSVDVKKIEKLVADKKSAKEISEELGIKLEPVESWVKFIKAGGKEGLKKAADKAEKALK